MHLALVIPALNEEGAIAATLRRALIARSKVIARTGVRRMTVVFVNDGSTDRTQEIVDAPEFDEVVKVHFERNRGYGAAIQAGWQATDADLLGFVDADGTCDPDFCVELVNRLVEADADVVLADRMTSRSEMPRVRRIGNRIFALLLGVVSQHMGVRDTASGFRIVRRSSLKLLTPLPSGLHFTPAMSCTCLLDPRLRIEAVPMDYKERIGRSKLSVVKDGFRFLYTILFSACCYAPLKTMIGFAAITVAACAAAAALLSALGAPAAAVGGTILAGAIGVTVLLHAGLVTHQFNFLLIGPRREVGPAERLLQRLLDYKGLIAGGAVAALAGAAAAVGLGALGLTTGAAGLAAMLACLYAGVTGLAAALAGVMVRVAWAVGEKQKAMLEAQAAAASPAGVRASRPEAAPRPVGAAV